MTCMLNFGPKGDGSIRKEEQFIAGEVGKWMKINGEAIYNCEGAGLPEQKWGYYTMNHKTGKVYMVVFNKPVNGALRVKLHKGTRLVEARLLNGKKKLDTEEISRQEYFVHINGKVKGKYPFVIEIDLRQGEGGAEKQYVAPKI